MYHKICLFKLKLVYYEIIKYIADKKRKYLV